MTTMNCHWLFPKFWSVINVKHAVNMNIERNTISCRRRYTVWLKVRKLFVFFELSTTTLTFSLLERHIHITTQCRKPTLVLHPRLLTYTQSHIPTATKLRCQQQFWVESWRMLYLQHKFLRKVLKHTLKLNIKQPSGFCWKPKVSVGSIIKNVNRQNNSKKLNGSLYNVFSKVTSCWSLIGLNNFQSRVYFFDVSFSIPSYR